MAAAAIGAVGTAGVLVAGADPASAGVYTVTILGPQLQLVQGIIDTVGAGPGLTNVTRNVTQCSGPSLCCDTQAFEAQFIQASQQWAFQTYSNATSGCWFSRGYRFQNLEGVTSTNDLIRHKYRSSNATGGNWSVIGDNRIRP